MRGLGSRCKRATQVTCLNWWQQKLRKSSGTEKRWLQTNLCKVEMLVTYVQNGLLPLFAHRHGLISFLHKQPKLVRLCV